MTDRELVHGDCLDVMRGMPDESFTAVVTDPPYGLEFMGKEWDRLGPIGQASHSGPRERDGSTVFGRQRIEYGASANKKCLDCGRWAYSGNPCKCERPTWLNVKAHQGRAMQEWHLAWATEVLRLLKPGGLLLAFGGTRTYHRLACAVEDAGFEVRDTIAWMQGSGFPKSLDVSKAIDKAAGAEGGRGPMKRGGERLARLDGGRRDGGGRWGDEVGRDPYTYAPATDLARRWHGYGTALKPAHEPIVVAPAASATRTRP